MAILFQTVLTFMSAFLPNLDEVLQIIVFMSPLSALCHSCTLFASLIMFKLKYKA